MDMSIFLQLHIYTQNSIHDFFKFLNINLWLLKRHEKYGVFCSIDMYM